VICKVSEIICQPSQANRLGEGDCSPERYSLVLNQGSCRPFRRVWI
jgi:hypothetical protein